ncbi:DUF3343 domain-containing protein [Ruminococcaceae bacterium OttesenSCG-928-I18]|nr:DUF3343 domain-containing protein [Ruminococcaceae bacterium OttesenSCG-928-I18]
MMQKADQEIVLTFSGTHDAITSDKILQQGGLKVRTMPLPDQIGAGCGICVRVDEPDRETALSLLREAGIQPEGVYYAKRGPQGMQYTPVPIEG